MAVKVPAVIGTEPPDPSLAVPLKVPVIVLVVVLCEVTVKTMLEPAVVGLLSQISPPVSENMNPPELPVEEAVL